MNKTEKIFNTLKKSDLPLKAGEIADATNIDKKDVDKIIKTLKKEGKISSPKRCYYSIS